MALLVTSVLVIQGLCPTVGLYDYMILVDLLFKTSSSELPNCGVVLELVGKKFICYFIPLSGGLLYMKLTRSIIDFISSSSIVIIH